jgi:hypothetical protein
MASTLSSTQADPRFHGGVAPTVAKEFTDVEEALARLVHASYTPEADPQGADPAHEQRSLGKRGTLRVAIAVCLGASAIWAWRSYDGPAPDQATAPPAIETSAPPPAQAASIAQPATMAANEPAAASAERQQIETSDLAALRQTVEQLAAGQEQLTRELAKLQAEKPQVDKPPAEKPDKRMLRRVSAHPVPPVAAPARKPAPIAPMPPQAAPQVSTVSRLSPPPRPVPQIPSETRPSDRPPLRPPMPVPQP